MAMEYVHVEMLSPKTTCHHLMPGIIHFDIPADVSVFANIARTRYECK